MYDEQIEIKVGSVDINWKNEEMDLKTKMGLPPKTKQDRPSYKSQENLCAICDYVICGRSPLLNHYLVHKEKKIKANMKLIKKYGEEDFFRCSICMKEFVLKPQLEKHSEYHVERPFFCVKCNKSFKQSRNFITHMDSHHYNVELKCRLCEFTTKFKLPFIKHVRSHVRETNKCDECDKVFSDKTSFLDHKNFHTGEKPFSCEECDKCYHTSRSLTAHKRSMHFKEPELNECKICKKRFLHKNSLRVHMKIHTIDNFCLCDVCGKRLSCMDKLQLHMRSHTGYKPYFCFICDKSFTNKETLTCHIRVHTYEKPFICEVCGKCFSQRTPLTLHKRLHTGERPFLCHLCNKGFVSQGILNRHLKHGKH